MYIMREKRGIGEMIERCSERVALMVSGTCQLWHSSAGWLLQERYLTRYCRLKVCS
jgi:hypothetical protein